VKAETTGKGGVTPPENGRHPAHPEGKAAAADIGARKHHGRPEGRIHPRKEKLASQPDAQTRVFVTLKPGQLRGCIGHFGQEMPLATAVRQMAAAAAVEDYRFAYNPVTLKEMGSIRRQDFILSELRRIQIGRRNRHRQHGIWVKQGRNGGTYLPSGRGPRAGTGRNFCRIAARRRRDCPRTHGRRARKLCLTARRS